MRHPAYYAWRLVPLAIGLFFGWGLVMAVLCIRAEGACLERGYPTAQVTASGKVYCIRRILQTDYVIALDELKAAKR